MKKALSAALAAAFAVSSAVPVLADNGINVIVNGSRVVFSDQDPVIKNDRVLVPLRNVLEEMGIEVKWDDLEKSAFTQRGLAYAQFTIGDSALITDSETITLDVAPEIINGRAMIPLRAIAEAFDADVNWDSDTKTVTVTDSDMITAVNTEKIEVDGKAEDGTVIYTVEIKYPVLNENVEGYGKTIANETIKDIILKNIEPIQAEMKTAAEEYYAAVKDDKRGDLDFRPLSIAGNYKVTFLSDSIVSLYYDIDADFMGAHPMTYRDGITVELVTGKEIAMSDVIIGDTKAAVKAAYKKAVDENPDIFFPNVMETFDESADSIDFYLEDGSIVLFAPLYAVAPYAGGFIPVRLNYEADKNTESNNDWTVELTASYVTSTGLKLALRLADGAPTGELDTGSEFWLEKKDGDKWVDVESKITNDQLAWTAEAYSISSDKATELTVNWSYLYGELPKGEYRIGKKIMDFREAGDFDEKTFYAEFEIK